MIHYYTNRELAQKLEINLARWKRWSREFLPPDPLGGLQSGYARQYLFKDLFKVFLGGHLLSHLKLSLVESRQVVADLSPWLKKNGFLEENSLNGRKAKVGGSNRQIIYFCPAGSPRTKNGTGFRYLIREVLEAFPEKNKEDRQITVTYQESCIPSNDKGAAEVLNHPEVRMIHLTGVWQQVVAKLGRSDM
jgi:hypothetical protein